MPNLCAVFSCKTHELRSHAMCRRDLHVAVGELGFSIDARVIVVSAIFDFGKFGV